MDPLTALSVAGTIIQFVDFGSKLLSSGIELYKSVQGTLKVHEELELVTSDLNSVIIKFRQRSRSPLGEIDRPLTTDNQHQEDSFHTICDEAARIANELLTRLQKLKVKANGKLRSWESLKAAVKAAWSQDEIASLTRRLSTLKEVFYSRYMLSLGYRCSPSHFYLQLY
jgi:hypothetical protein